MRGGKSSAVSTACTPAIARAADASIERIFAWACGLRTKHACSVPTSLMSSTKRPRPVSSAGSSRRATRAPKCFAPMVDVPERRNAAATIYGKHCNAIAADRTLVRETIGSRQCSRSAPMRGGAGSRFPAPPLDFQSHLCALEGRGLLLRVDRPINKDTELHPLVRWQFQGGLKEDQRRAFLFTNVTDSSGRRYDVPVAVGALAASPQIYAVGMGRPVEEIGEAWLHAIANPIAPTPATAAPCQD